MKKYAYVDRKYCVACGACVKVCPKKAIHIDKGCYAVVDINGCVGCGMCSKICPIGVIFMRERSSENEK